MITFNVFFLRFHETDLAAYIGENGKLKGLPVNEHGSAFAQKSLFAGDQLVGPIVFVNANADEKGNHLPLTIQQRNELDELLPTLANPLDANEIFI